MQTVTVPRIVILLALSLTLLISDGCSSNIDRETIKRVPDHTLEIQQLNKALSKLDEQLTKETHKTYTFQATITAYHAVTEQCDSTPEITAFGTKSRPGVTCAVSEKLRWDWPYIKQGDLLIVRGKMCVVEDLMNKRYRGIPWVDMMVRRNSKVFKWENETVTLIQGRYDD